MFIIQCLSLAVSLLTIYIVLKWYKFSFIEKSKPVISEDETDNNGELKSYYRRNNLYRLAWILAALFVNAIAYFFAHYNGAAYLAIMLLLCLPFIYCRK